MKYKAIILSVVALFFIAACDMPSMPTNQQAEQNHKKQQTVQELMAKQGTAALDFSMDRYLLKERLERFNDPNKMSYLYVFTPSGPVIQFTILGKVASTGKRLTMPVQQYEVDRGQYKGTDLGPAPDEMGVYGESSGGGKVGMTTLGSLIEFGGFGFYFYSEVPVTFTGLDRPLVTLEVTATDAEKAELMKKMQSIGK